MECGKSETGEAGVKKEKREKNVHRDQAMADAAAAASVCPQGCFPALLAAFPAKHQQPRIVV